MPTNGPLKPLSERERQIVEFAMNGLTDVAIAHRLGISEATVATYWGRIRTKYGPLSRPELIAHAVRNEFEKEIEDLKAQNQALVRSLRQSAGQYKSAGTEAFFQEALESAADAILVVDQEGTIDWVNTAALELFGYKQAEIVGKHQMMLIPERYRRAHQQHVKNYFALPSRRTMSEHTTTLAVTKDEEEFAVVATLSPLESDKQLFAICIVRRVSSAAAADRQDEA